MFINRFFITLIIRLGATGGIDCRQRRRTRRCHDKLPRCGLRQVADSNPQVLTVIYCNLIIPINEFNDLEDVPQTKKHSNLGKIFSKSVLPIASNTPVST